MARSGPNDHLRLVRLSKRLSQDKLAEAIGTSGPNVGRWERGEAIPNEHFRNKLCTFFQVEPAELGFFSDASSVAVMTAPDNKMPIYDPAIPLKSPIPLVGRDEMLLQLKERLCIGSNVTLVALNGLPGVGKTALAIALAHDPAVRAYFSDGILWAGLGPHPDTAELLSRWGRLLGMPSNTMAELHSSEAWARTLHMTIGARRMLLVIDDAWQIDDVLTFKVGGANCAHLITTRFPSIASHIDTGNATMIQELSVEDSMALLKLLAPGVLEHEVGKAEDLVRTISGLPLALTLVGNYLRKQAYGGQSRRIQSALKRLTDAQARLHLSEVHSPGEGSPSLASDAPLSLQSVIAVSDQQLNEQTRAVLYALSVFPAKPHSFSEEAALKVANCSVAVLDTLIDSGLLESSGSDRYTLHQTIADYAHAHLKDNTISKRFITYAIDYVEAHKTDYEMLARESSVLLAALEVAYELEAWSELIRGVGAFAPFLLVRGVYPLAEPHLQRMYEVARILNDKSGLTSALLFLGELAHKQGLYEQAEAYFQEGLAIARQVGDPERICALLADLGWVIWKRGAYTQAEIYLQEGLILARQIGNRERICSLLKVLGSVVGSRGDYAQSEAYVQEGLELARQIGDREQMCALLISLGATEAEQGHYAQAAKYFQEGLELARQIVHREWTSLLLVNLGDMAVEQENYLQAEAYYLEGLDLARQIGHREWNSILLLSLGDMAQKQGNYVQAEKYMQESLNLAKQISRPQIMSQILYSYGNFYLKQKRVDAAEITFREMLNTIPEGDQELLVLARYGLAQVAAAQGNLQKAQELGEASAVAFEEMGNRKAKEVRSWLIYIKQS